DQQRNERGQRAESERPTDGQGARRHHRRRQLRELVRAGRPPLQGRVRHRGRPRPDARRPRRLPRQGHRVHGRLRHRRGQGRQGPRPGDLVGPEQHDQVRRRPREARRQGPSRDDPRRPRQVPQGEDHEGARRDRRHRQDPQGHEDRRRRLLPPGRVRAGHEVVRRAGPRGRLRLRELHPGVHRPRELLERALQEGRPADRRRRHQVAGRRDDRAPHARPPVPR
ncbi:MAG: Inositol-1-phosphate synthase, partial [uncultured Solirubrobacteraceae bacterium]